ncbi:MAG TPA: histidinol-phosphate transaminase [Gemmatimonadaceae bacterium]|nr:histidinol-phosphate transaminase [Gemmatimonadaceae bacterium]
MTTKDTVAGTVAPRALVGALAAYEVEIPRAAVDLSNNTSAFGVAPAVLDVIRSARAEHLVSYPSAYSGTLREAIAAHVGVEARAVMVGCGSDDVLDCTFRTFAGDGRSAAILDPTFVMARIFALTNGLHPIPVPLRADRDVDADAVLATRASVTYLCSPNNPTANSLSRDAVARIVARASGVVMIDEAYAEYGGESWASRAPELGNVVVLRTFSKAFGLAGLRVGYGVASPALIAELEKVRGPYKVTSIGEQAALAALSDDGLAWMRDAVARTRELRDRFLESLQKAGLAPLSSVTNFVLVPVPDAVRAARTLGEHGIGVRALPRLRGIGDALRISVGVWPHLERVVAVLAGMA